MDNNGVQFDEDTDALRTAIPRAKPSTMTEALMHAGIASRPGDAMIILAIFAMLLIGGSIFLIATSVPQPPTLGHDVLRDGETVPSYVR